MLNLMPCVLPVLSLKLLALVGYAGAERRAARLGLLATAAGVVVSFGVLAAVLIGLKEAGAAIGWGIQFQQPWFLAGMALLTTLFAASLWDWLPLAIPGGVAGAAGSVRGRGPLGDAFLLGAFATLLAASCSAPFVGTAIGFALARGPLDIALVFGALGLGMAAPFLAVAAAPRLVAWLPRPGAWMVWLRRVLGLALLGTAAWLLSVLAVEASAGAALLAGVILLAPAGNSCLAPRLPPGRRARRAAGAGRNRAGRRRGAGPGAARPGRADRSIGIERRRRAVAAVRRCGAAPDGGREQNRVRRRLRRLVPDLQGQRADRAGPGAGRATGSGRPA